MDEKKIVKEILSLYDEIKITNEDDNFIFFELYGNEYGIVYPLIEAPISRPAIIIKDNKNYEYPHIMLSEIPINGNMYRSICLYEAGSQIEYLKTYEEKVIDAIDRLFELLNLSSLEIEKEFQKEFLFYWNMQAETFIDAYIQSDRVFHKMNVYVNQEGNFRLISPGIKLNDKKEFRHFPNLDVYYIPIIDNRGILPPVKNKMWKPTNILDILKGRTYKRIDTVAYKTIKDEKVKGNETVFIFEMIINKQIVTFGVKIRFRKTSYSTLMEKIEYAVETIECLKVNRCDYYYLNKQIGNDVSIIGKKIAIIGAGSLGSYIAVELVKSGIKDLSLYDHDIIEKENILRHQSAFVWCDCSKVNALRYKLQKIHPEIIIKANKEYVTDEILERDANEFDMLIFAVGSSDTQLLANRFLKKIKFSKPVLYVWLEAGGIDSHILYVDYSQAGCFECLYTDENGNLINNKVNKTTEEQIEKNIIRNGCGATRVAYGTSILLRTTSTVLDVVQRLFNGEIKENLLIDIDKSSIKYQGNKFIESRCSCCSDSN